MATDSELKAAKIRMLDAKAEMYRTIAAMCAVVAPIIKPVVEQVVTEYNSSMERR